MDGESAHDPIGVHSRRRPGLMAEDIRWQQRFSIEQGEAWMLMIQDRNLTSHT
ncbi:hypothetical protein [Synechococcus sp. CCY9202]|uniref:hypothetical protein n=1 Tax=Synechococcus sp. CCY9202 TaxID=174698 RepID=UPI002B20E6D1|nr:hypothetical protein [Synechococcus sp. CCY9202]MEA5424556.1 hypothetical protein [Synechococcus sp. CCY9202]